jgi:hypothetical protein
VWCFLLPQRRTGRSTSEEAELRRHLHCRLVARLKKEDRHGKHQMEVGQLGNLKMAEQRIVEGSRTLERRVGLGTLAAQRVKEAQQEQQVDLLEGSLGLVERMLERHIAEIVDYLGQKEELRIGVQGRGRHIGVQVLHIEIQEVQIEKQVLHIEGHYLVDCTSNQEVMLLNLVDRMVLLHLHQGVQTYLYFVQVGCRNSTCDGSLRAMARAGGRRAKNQ